MATEKLRDKYLSAGIVEKLKNDTLTYEEKSELFYKWENIFKILSTYIPTNIVLSKTRDLKSNIHNGRFIKGSLLFVDVNGFTALTEKLSEYGDAGTEEITRILNAFFTRMIKIIFKYRGVLLKYGGDAMMIYFSDDKEFCGNEHTLHAASCAFEMIEKVKAFSPVKSQFGEHNIHISVAMHSNTFFEICTGEKNIHIEYFITGPGVEKTAKIESASGKDELLADEYTYNFIKDKVKDFGKKQNYFLIKKLDAKQLPEVTQSRINIDFPDIDTLLKHLDEILPYVTAGVFEKIKESWKSLSLEGENRPVSVLFLNYFFDKPILEPDKNHDEKEIRSVLDKYFRMVQETVNGYGGIINKVDMYEKGDKIIIIFGFPRSYADDDERVVRCAYDILTKGSSFKNLSMGKENFSVVQRMGIHSDFIYCGNAGSPLRKEYTFMGDAVNLSARIMSSAGENEIWISDVILKKTSKVSIIKESQEKKFKGKGKPVLVHKLSAVAAKEKIQSDFFIGREKELKELINKVNGINRSFFATQLIGTVGVGKTSLMREFLKNINIRHEMLLGRGAPYGKEIQYNAIKEILTSYFGIIRRDNDEAIRKKINTYLEYLKLTHLEYTMPLVGSLLCNCYENAPVMEIENPIEKKELFFNAFYNLIKARTQISPIIMLIEDGEWLDKNSQELISYLAKRKMEKLFILVLTRNKLVLAPDIEEMSLNVFNKQETFEFIEKYPHLNNLDVNIKNKIYEKSKGVPYFIYEILNSMRDLGTDIKIPESIYKSVLSRMDVLGEKNKNIIKNASVIGVEFSLEMLNKLLIEIKDKEKVLERLIEEDFIVKKTDGHYLFRNMMVQEVAYNSIPSSKRKELHFKIANLIEDQGELAPYYEILSTHFEKAEIIPKAVFYYEKSGDKAYKLNNYKRAIDYYNLALSLTENNADKAQSIVSIYKKMGKIYLILGKTDNSEEVFDKAYEIAKENNYKPDIADCLLNKGLIHFNYFEYDKAIEYFTQAKTLYHETKNLNGIASSSLNLGIIYKVKGDSGKAFSEYEIALEKYIEEENLIGSADTYNNLGNLCKELSDFEKAIGYYQKALETLKKINHDIGLASVYNNIGTLYNSKGETEKSIEYFLKSLEIEDKIGNEKGKAVCYNNLGNSYIRMGKWEFAEENFTKGLELAYNIKDNKEVANIYLNNGVMFLYKNDLEYAKSYLKNAQDIYTTINDAHGLYSTYYNLGITYQKQDQFDLALTSFENAIDFAAKLDKKTFSMACVNISKNFCKTKRYDKAKEIIKKGIQTLKDKPFYNVKIRLLGLAANIYKNSGELVQAKKYLEQVIELKNQNNDQKGASYTRLQFAMLLLEMGEIENASKELEKAESYFDSINDTIGKIFSINKIGVLYLNRKEYNKAMEYFEKGVNEFNAMGFEAGSAMLLKKIGIIHYKIKDYKNAIFNLEKAQAIEERIQSRNINITYEILGKILLELDESETALDYLEKSYMLEVQESKKRKHELAFELGELFRKYKKYGSAAIYFEKCAISHNKKIALNSLKELSIIYEKVGKKERLRNALKRILMFETDEETKILISDSLNRF